jgi:YbbR domain-containing protein
MNWLRKFVFHNFGLKLVSLLAAVLLWMAVSREPATEIAVNVPIEFQHADGLEIVSNARIPQAQILVRGPARIVRSLAQSDVHATLDLAGAKPGERTFDLYGRQIRVPHDVELVEIVPAQLHLTLDRTARKEVPIVPRVTGINERYAVEVTPASVLIAGPEQHVLSVESALTDPVDASGVSATTTFSGIHVYLTDPLVRVVRPSTVTLTLVPKSLGN